MTLLLQDARRELKKIVDANPDHVYEAPEDLPSACWYLHPDGPGCIIGHLFVAQGIERSDIMLHEERSASDAAADLGVIPEGHGTLGDYLDVIQNRQDNGETWAKAFAAGDELLRENGYAYVIAQTEDDD